MIFWTEPGPHLSFPSLFVHNPISVTFIDTTTNRPFETEKFGLENIKPGLYLILGTEQRSEIAGLEKIGSNSLRLK